MNLFKILNRAERAPAPAPAIERAGGLTIRRAQDVNTVRPTGSEHSDAVQREIIGEVVTRKPKLYQEFGHVPLPRQVWAACVKEAGLASERAELAKICTEFKRLEDFRGAHNPTAALLAAEKHGEDMRRRLAEGDFQGLTAQDSRGKAEIQADYKRKEREAYGALCSLSHEAAAPAERIAAKLSAAAQKLARRFEVEERAEADRWGVAFRPSNQLIAIGQASWRASEVTPVAGTSDSPAALLSLISE